MNEKKEELNEKEQEILNLKDKISQLKQRIVFIKEDNKISENKEIDKLNNKINYLINEFEIGKSKMELMKKNHKILQDKYLKVTSELRKRPQEEILYKTKKLKEQKLKRHFSGSSNETNSKSDKVNLPLIKSINIKKNNNNVGGEIEKNENEINQKNET